MIKKETCSGCTACSYMCPVNAIQIKTDSLTGFKLAEVDTNKCIDCNKCNSICPNISNKEKKDISAITRYVIRMSDNITSHSSSGGAFSLLSSYFLKLGFIIVGVKWDDNFNAIYSFAKNLDEFKSFRGSKYIQADIGELFSKIKIMLDNNEKILFIGTPCHVSGLLNYLGKDYKYLWTIDFICNSLPSPMIWQKWLQEENFVVDDIKDINMRYKDGMGASNPKLRIVKKNGDIHDLCLKNTNFYRCTMKSKMGILDACDSCKYRKIINHRSDFVIGDLWDAEKKYEDYWDENDANISFLSCNNNRAKKVLEKASNIYKKTIMICEKIEYGGSLKSTQKDLKNKRDIFYEKIKNNSIIDFYKKNKKNKLPYDVAIAGGTMCNNFGGALTYYALYKYIESLNLNPIIIPPTIDSLGVVLLDNIFEKHCNISYNYHINGNQSNFNDLSNTFLIGSDQMWNYNIFKEWKLNPYLDYVYDNKNKIAFGVSYGNNYKAPNKILNEIKRLIGKFNYISHREPSGLTISKDIFNRKDTVLVIDPVFLCDNKIYESLIEESELNKKEREEYVCTYLLSSIPEVYNMASIICDTESIREIVIGSGNVNRFSNTKLKMNNIDFVNPITVQDWLYYIKNAKYVLTDSLHAICFSIIFEKPFLVINKQSDERITNILDICGLKDRIVEGNLYKAGIKIKEDIDFKAVKDRLNKHIDFSKNWLNEVLKKCV